MNKPAADGEQPKKKRHPPTFQHLPRDRAKKLKKEWVEKKKLKSQWKAQKRREGLDHRGSLSRGNEIALDAGEGVDAVESRGDDEKSTFRRQTVYSGDDDEGDSTARAFAPASNAVLDSDLEEAEFNSQPAHAAAALRQDQHAPGKPDRSSSDKKSAQTEKKRRRSSSSTPARNRQHETNSNDGADGGKQPSLREMTRRAYARTSLHTVKSDTFKKRTRTVGPAAVQVENSRGGRGRGGGRGGQPNMRLRMEAMLERIKRDCS